MVRPPDKSAFFIDESSGAHLLCDRLHQAGQIVKSNKDCKLENGCDDPEWIAAVARNGWCFITNDKYILDNGNLGRLAIEKHKAAGFVVRITTVNHATWMPVLAADAERMHKLLRKYSRPFAAKIKWNAGKIEFDVVIGERAGGKKKDH